MAIHKWCMNFSMLLMFQSPVMKVGTNNLVKYKIPNLFVKTIFIQYRFLFSFLVQMSNRIQNQNVSGLFEMFLLR